MTEETGQQRRLDADGVFEARRQALLIRTGQPRHLRAAPAVARLLGGAAAGLNADEMVAYRYPSREVAEAWHRLNHDHHGHTSLGVIADPAGDGWLGVMDVRRQLAAMRAEHEAQRPREEPGGM